MNTAYTRPSGAPFFLARILCVPACLVASLAACQSTPGPSKPPDDSGAASAGPCAFERPPAEATGVELVPAFEHVGLSGTERHRLVELVPSPWVPGEWYLVQQHGRIFRIHEDPDEEGYELALDVRGDPRLYIGPEEAGLTSLAFHPTRREAYIVYTAPTEAPNAELESRLSRFEVEASGSIDPDSEELILNLPQPRPAHSGDQVLFGPDGKLYYSAGDGGLPEDGGGHGQDAHTLYGTLMRLDVDAEDSGRGTPYAIPDDNPFADGRDGAPEVFAYGFRNPWRFSFDRETGDIWLGDVGDAEFEEINRVVAGGNYGWSTLEGNACYRAGSCDRSGLEPPLVAYDHDDGISVIGGFVYRGGDVPELNGRYVYADYIFGNLWSIDAEARPGDAPEPRLEVTAPFWISSFAESPNGELYVVNFTFGDTDRPREGEGGLYKLAPAAPEEPSGFPTKLSATGCIDMNEPTRPARGLLAYDPRASLWSDGADKDRFLRLPPDSKLEVEPDGDFLFPEGSVLVKNFRFGSRLHETRLLIRHAEAGWRGYSYRWNGDQTEATLLESGKSEMLSNGVYWRYPSRTQCDFCHTEAAGHVLGPEARQLGFARGDAGESQIEALFEAELFDPDVGLETLREVPSLSDPGGEDGPGRRARSYLHANCSICHRPGGVSRVDIDLRFDVPLSETGLCNGEPKLGTLGGDASRRRLVVPGDPDNSVLWLRMRADGSPRMPPLGTEIVDEEAVATVEAWIAGLEECP